MGDKHAIADRLVGPERAESDEIEIGLWSRRPSISSYQRNWSRHSGRLITIDRDTHRDLRSILQVSQSAILANTEELATGWGEYRARVDEFTIGGCSPMLLRLPHLSTFQLFTSTRCRNQRQEIIASACRHLSHSSKAFSLVPFRR